MSKGYVFEEEGTRRIISAVRKIEDRNPTGTGPRSPRRNRYFYSKTWYKIKTNDGSGQYTVRKQQWEVTTSQLQDVTNSYDPEYNLDLTAWDSLGRDAGTVDQFVQGWQTLINGQWVLLIDVTVVASASVRPGKITAVTQKTGLGTDYHTYQGEYVDQLGGVWPTALNTLQARPGVILEPLKVNDRVEVVLEWTDLGGGMYALQPIGIQGIEAVEYVICTS